MPWLTREAMEGGGRVLCLARHAELLEPAAAAFCRAAGIADRGVRSRTAIALTAHCPVNSIRPTDDFVIASIASLAHHSELIAELVDDPRVHVVVDEYHHGIAAS